MYIIHCSDKVKFEFVSDLLNNSNKNFIFKQIYFFDSIVSTQDFVFELIAQTDKLNPSVIISEIQTGGKGRKGEKWSSPKGGIWMSIFFELDIQIANQFSIVILTSLLLCNIIQDVTNKKAEIKWPNDIMLNGKKVAGILLDAQIERGKKTNVILGLGINVNNDLTETATQMGLDRVIDYDITSIKNENSGIKIINESLIVKILYKFSDQLYRLNETPYRNELFAKYKRMIEEYSSQRKYRFTSGGKPFKGEIVSVNDDGSIIVRNLQDFNNINLVRIDSAFSIR